MGNGNIRYHQELMWEIQRSIRTEVQKDMVLNNAIHIERYLQKMDELAWPRMMTHYGGSYKMLLQIWDVVELIRTIQQYAGVPEADSIQKISKEHYRFRMPCSFWQVRDIRTTPITQTIRFHRDTLEWNPDSREGVLATDRCPEMLYFLDKETPVMEVMVQNALLESRKELLIEQMNHSQTTNKN